MSALGKLLGAAVDVAKTGDNAAQFTKEAISVAPSIDEYATHIKDLAEKTTNGTARPDFVPYPRFREEPDIAIIEQYNAQKRQLAEVVSTPVYTEYGGPSDKLFGPRPTGGQLSNASQIPGFEPTNAREALFAGTRYYQNTANETVGLRQVDNPRRISNDPLAHGNTEKVGSRRDNRNSTNPDQQRGAKEARQTLGKVDFYKSSSRDLKGHHGMGLDQYDPFFVGLSTKEQKRLAEHVKDTHNRYLGSKQQNRMDLPSNVHDILHEWERLTSAKLTKDRIAMDGRSLSERKVMIDTYIEQIQPAYEEMTYLLMQNKSLPKKQLMQLMLSEIDS